MEVCVDTLKSAIIAEEAGASRIELCQSLSVGGLTPSLGLMCEVKKNLSIPVFVLIRPRSGDFCFSESEIQVMKADVISLVASGADGIVIGALLKTGEIDVETCTRLIDSSGGVPVTFNRAFDLCVDPMKSLEHVISLKCSRLLTSGQDCNASEGLPLIKKLISQGDKRITIVPAGGIRKENLEEILTVSGAKEFHASASVLVTSEMLSLQHPLSVSLGDAANVFVWKECSKNIVQSLLAITKRVWQ